MLAAHDTQLQTRFGMTGTVQTQERGGAGGAQPPLNCLTYLNAALHCKDQAAISEMVEQEQWGTEGAQPPLNCSHYIGYNFNAGCSAGSAPLFVIRRITPTCFGRKITNVTVIYGVYIRMYGFGQTTRMARTLAAAATDRGCFSFFLRFIR